jgi:uncharacterized protein (TIRG00374 family)
MTAAPLPSTWVAPARRVAGVVVSVAFLALTISRVDLAGAASAISRVAPLGILVALLLAGGEVAIRAERWRRLLTPFAPVGFRTAFAYLCIGYFANTLLPARLGDVARAVLAARAFSVPRLTTLGTILLERVADGVLILAITAGLAVALPEARPLLETARIVALIGGAGLLALALTLLVTHRSRVATTRGGGLVRSVLARLGEGLAGARTPYGLAVFTGLSVLAFAVAVGALLTIATALGVGLTLPQAALVMGALALSTAIPAAPGSIGTYEFVGLTTLTGIGVAPEPAIALVVLVHLIATVPPALAGLAMTAVLHLNVFATTSATGEPVLQGVPAGR